MATPKPSDPASPAPHSQRPLRLLIAASVILPLAIFAIASWLSYRNHQIEARDRVERTLGLVHEHATKVFETFEISERYLEEMFRDVSDEEIIANEKTYSERIKSLSDRIPQIRDLWVIDAKGFPLVAGWTTPIPRTLDLSDRNYFRAHSQGDGVSTYISETVGARLAELRFFAITRKRLDANGKFNGVYLVSIAPDYFTNFYSQLPRARNSAMALVRGDGTVLARYPSLPAKANPPSMASSGYSFSGNLPTSTCLSSAASTNPRSSQTGSTQSRRICYSAFRRRW